MSSTIDTPYWLYTWLDAHGLRDAETASRSLRDAKVFADLRECAAAAGAIQVDAPSGQGIVAGGELDLSARLGCSFFDCRRPYIDTLLHRIWHYFDYVVVADNAVKSVAWAARSKGRQRTAIVDRWVVQDIALALHVRSIGADKLLHFRPRETLCDRHSLSEAIRLGLPNPNGLREALTNQLASEGAVRGPRRVGKMFHFQFVHPRLGAGYVLEGTKKALSATGAESALRQLAAHTAERYVSIVTTDMTAAEAARLPLGADDTVYSELLAESGPRETLVPAVAFGLDLPFVGGIPIETLIRIRAEERDAFNRFKAALREAVKDRLAASANAEPAIMADEIRRDVIEPRVAEIARRLKAATRLAFKKSAVGVALATFTTGCGLIAGIAESVALASGAAALSTSVMSAVAKRLEQVDELRQDDMFFLWKAATHSHE